MKNTILGCAFLGKCLIKNQLSIEQAVEEAWKVVNDLEEKKIDLDFNDANLINVQVSLMIAYLALDKKEVGETSCLLKEHQEFYRAANRLQDLEEVSLKQKTIALLLLQLIIDDDKKETVFSGDAAKKRALIDRVSFLNKTLTQYLHKSQGRPYVSLSIIWSKFNPTLKSRVLSLSDKDKKNDQCSKDIEACEKLKQAKQARIAAIAESAEALKGEFTRLKQEIEDHYANILAQELARIDTETAEMKRKIKKQLEKGAVASLVAIGVTVATCGATATLAASMVASKTAAHVMITAGMSALIAKMTASMVMHNGHIERVASDLLSTDTLKTTVVAMISAGMLHQACKVLDIPLDFADRKEISEHLNYNLAKACINSGINVGINHQDKDKALLFLAVNTMLQTIVEANAKADLNNTTRIAMHTGAGYVSGLVTNLNPGQSALESFVGAAVSSGVSTSTDNVLKKVPKVNRHLVQAFDKSKTEVQKNNRDVVKLTPRPVQRSGLVGSNFEAELHALHQKTQDLLLDAELKRSFKDITRGFRSLSVENNTFPNTSHFGAQPVLLWSVPNRLSRASENTLAFKNRGTPDSSPSDSAHLKQYLDSLNRGIGRVDISVLNMVTGTTKAAKLPSVMEHSGSLWIAGQPRLNESIVDKVLNFIFPAAEASPLLLPAARGVLAATGAAAAGLSINGIQQRNDEGSSYQQSDARDYQEDIFWESSQYKIAKAQVKQRAFENIQEHIDRNGCRVINKMGSMNI